MGEAGFGTYRVPVNWAAIQPNRNGGYDWSQPDQGVFNAAKTRDAADAGRLRDAAKFVHKASDKGLYGPDEQGRPEGVAEVLRGARAPLQPERRLLRRGARDRSPPGQDVDRLERAELEEQLAPEARSARLRQGSSRTFDKGISKVDPKAKIVLGGMYGYPRDPKSMKAAKFLKKLYKVQGHREALRRGQRTSLRLRRRRRQAADRRPPLGRRRRPATATSASSSASSAGRRTDRRGASRSSASRVRRSGSATASKLLAKKRKRWNVLGAFVYVWRDFPAGQLACNWCPWAGLVTKKSKPKPALKAVKKVIRANR